MLRYFVHSRGVLWILNVWKGKDFWFREVEVNRPLCLYLGPLLWHVGSGVGSSFRRDQLTTWIMPGVFFFVKLLMCYSPSRPSGQSRSLACSPFLQPTLHDDEPVFAAVPNQMNVANSAKCVRVCDDVRGEDVWSL